MLLQAPVKATGGGWLAVEDEPATKRSKSGSMPTPTSAGERGQPDVGQHACAYAYAFHLSSMPCMLKGQLAASSADRLPSRLSVLAMLAQLRRRVHVSGLAGLHAMGWKCLFA